LYRREEEEEQEEEAEEEMEIKRCIHERTVQQWNIDGWIVLKG